MKTNFIKSLLFIGFFIASIAGFGQQYSAKEIAIQKIDSILTDGTISKEKMIECFLYMADYADNSKTHRHSPSTFRRNPNPQYEQQERHYPALDGNKLRKISYPEPAQQQMPQREKPYISDTNFTILIASLFVVMFIGVCWIILIVSQRYFSDSKLSFKTMLDLQIRIENLETKTFCLESVIKSNKKVRPTEKI